MPGLDVRVDGVFVCVAMCVQLCVEVRNAVLAEGESCPVLDICARRAPDEPCVCVVLLRVLVWLVGLFAGLFCLFACLLVC